MSLFISCFSIWYRNNSKNKNKQKTNKTKQTKLNKTKTPI